MPFYYSLFLFMILSVIIHLIFSFGLVKKKIVDELFFEAQRNENNGHIAEAVTIYESVLTKIKKMRFYSNLKNIIIQKLKLLHLVIEYQKKLHFRPVT